MRKGASCEVSELDIYGSEIMSGFVIEPKLHSNQNCLLPICLHMVFAILQDRSGDYSKTGDSGCWKEAENTCDRCFQWTNSFCLVQIARKMGCFFRFWEETEPFSCCIFLLFSIKKPKKKHQLKTKILTFKKTDPPGVFSTCLKKTQGVSMYFFRNFSPKFRGFLPAVLADPWLQLGVGAGRKNGRCLGEVTPGVEKVVGCVFCVLICCFFLLFVWGKLVGWRLFFVKFAFLFFLNI